MAAKSDFNPKAQANRMKVEMLFAHLKRILKLGRLRLRGPCGVQDEFTLAAIAQNLRKLAKLRPQTTETRIRYDLSAQCTLQASRLWDWAEQEACDHNQRRDKRQICADFFNEIRPDLPDCATIDAATQKKDV